MLSRLYVHNYKCLVDFELDLGRCDSALLIGRHGVGKSSVRQALQILQRIARGDNRVGLIEPGPGHFEIEVELEEHQLVYELVLERPEGFREHRVRTEVLTCDGQELFTRHLSKVTLERALNETCFRVDWHVAALPLVQQNHPKDPLFLFRRWLASMVLLSPYPPAMSSRSDPETLEIESDAGNFAAWVAGLVANSPSTWETIERFVADFLPDLREIKNVDRRLEVHLKNRKLPFHALSDGEKCYLLAGGLVAAEQTLGPFLCFWDDVDQHISPEELEPFLSSLRRAFQGGSQLLVSSHHPQAIRHYSAEDTYLLESPLFNKSS